MSIIPFFAKFTFCFIFYTNASSLKHEIELLMSVMNSKYAWFIRQDAKFERSKSRNGFKKVNRISKCNALVNLCISQLYTKCPRISHSIHVHAEIQDSWNTSYSYKIAEVRFHVYSASCSSSSVSKHQSLIIVGDSKRKLERRHWQAHAKSIAISVVVWLRMTITLPRFRFQVWSCGENTWFKIQLENV